MRSSHSSAIIKERREYSTLRERHQSSALSTTTDDDGQNAMQQLINEQRRKRKKASEAKTIGTAIPHQYTASPFTHKQHMLFITKNSLPQNQLQKQLQLDNNASHLLLNQPTAFFTSTAV